MEEEKETSYEHASIILNEIRKRIPDAAIYVSALADYTEGVCSITGTWGLEKGKELAQEIDSKNEDVFPGPLLGPMSAKETAKDGCHLSPDGKRKLGNQMRLFFDSEDYSANDASIGYLGCSNTMQTAASYWFAGGKTLWDFDEDELHEYDGGLSLTGPRKQKMRISFGRLLTGTWKTVQTQKQYGGSFAYAKKSLLHTKMLFRCLKQSAKEFQGLSFTFLLLQNIQVEFVK